MVKKPRIYFAIENFYPLVGGAETQTLAQCKCLLEKGYEVVVVTYCYDKNWLRREVLDGLPIIRVGATFMGNRAAKTVGQPPAMIIGQGLQEAPQTSSQDVFSAGHDCYDLDALEAPAEL